MTCRHFRSLQAYLLSFLGPELQFRWLSPEGLKFFWKEERWSFMGTTAGHRKVNVLIALDKTGYDGSVHGGGRFFFDIISRINRERFNVIGCILRRDDSLKAELERQSVRVKYLQRSKFNPLVFFDFLQLIKNENIHVLHLNSFTSHQLGRLAAIIAGVPSIVHAHGTTDFPSSLLQRLFDGFLARFTDQLIAVCNEAKEVYVERRKIKPSHAI